VPEEYWDLVALFNIPKKKQILEAKFYGKSGEKIKISTEEQVNSLMEELKKFKYKVESVKLGTKKRNAAPPFTTSTLQQEAYRKLGFTAQKTMMLAQQLYEGIEIQGEGAVGLITYIRTDSTRVSSEAQKEAINFILQRYGKEYVPDKPNQFRSRKNAQDAHEAIRPTSILREPASIKTSLKRDQYRLYKLIYDRFIASQMTPAVYETISIDILGGDYLFRANGSRKIFQGYSIVYEESSDGGQEEKDVELPKLEEGEELLLKDMIPTQHFTQPPPRFTEASLVRTLEEMGIGRPSTYAPIISTITERGYVVRENKNLVPTELGFIVNDLMMEYFQNIVDYKFTADMEEQLDSIEEGKKDWRTILRDFYIPFEELLKRADEEITKIEIEDEESDIKCDKCGAKMVIKTGRYGKFLACPNFPDCRNTKPLVEEIDASCPKCGGKIVIRKTKKGRKFYGCDNYPNCDFVSWDPPVKEPCPNCGSYMLLKSRPGKGEIIVCSNKECGYTVEELNRGEKE